MLTYDAVREQWLYVYADEKGAVTRVEGRADGNRLALAGYRDGPGQPSLTVRTSLARREDRSISEVSEATRDEGVTWRPYGRFVLTQAPVGDGR